MEGEEHPLPTCYVGYALNPKKLRKSEVKTGAGVMTEWAGGGLADIVEPSASSPLDTTNPTDTDHIIFAPWDSTMSPFLQTKFHVIIHKLTEDIEKEESQEKLLALERYLQAHPDTKIIDPIESVRKVTSRIRTIENLQLAKQSSSLSPFIQPNFCFVRPEMTNEMIEELLLENKIVFPVICKPIEACGTPNSHSMVIVVRKEDIFMIPKPSVIQQYYNHDGVFFKAYVIDQDVMVYRRPSLPNLNLTTLNDDNHSFKNGISSSLQRERIHSLAFDSRYCYPKLENFMKNEYPSKICDSPKVWRQSPAMINRVPKVDHQCASDSATVFPKQKKAKRLEFINESLEQKDTTQTLLTSTEVRPEEELYELFVNAANELKKTFGLTLFGFDVILPSSSSSSSSSSSASSSFNGNSSSHEDRDIDFDQPEDGSVEESSSPTTTTTTSTPSQLMIIDVNYFPSYKEVKDFPLRLKRYLRKKAFEQS